MNIFYHPILKYALADPVSNMDFLLVSAGQPFFCLIKTVK